MFDMVTTVDLGPLICVRIMHSREFSTIYTAAVSVPLDQLGCHLSAQLHATSSILKAQLQ